MADQLEQTADTAPKHPDQSYFGIARREIAPLLPPTARLICDVGCGSGATLAWLATRYPAARSVALEGNPDCLPALRGIATDAHILDLNGPLPDIGAPDLLLCLDVLEHLVDPGQVLATLLERAAPDVTVIVSLPNVAHFSVAVPLLLAGRFERTDAGILDRTHLHFFNRAGVLALLRGAGLTVREGLMSGVGNPRSRWVDRATLGLLRDRLARQYIVAGRKGGTAEKVAWQAI